MNPQKSIRILFCFLLTVCLLLPALSFVPVQSANEELPEDKPAIDPFGETAWSSIIYDSNSGLMCSEATDIAESSDGFLWIGTYSGLVRYDGNSFERISPQKCGITSVKSLYTDKNGRLWIGTNGSGVFLKRQERYMFFDGLMSLSSASVRDIVEDSLGNIYVATTNGLYVIDKDLKAAVTGNPRLDTAFILDLEVDPNGLIYGLTNAGDIFTIKNGKMISFLSSEDNPIRSITSIYPDPVNTGYIYLDSTSDGFFHASLLERLNHAEKIDVSPLVEIQDIKYIDDRLWLCARNGAGAIFDGEFHYLDKVPLVNSVGHVIKDYEGNLWFSSTRQGVMKIVHNRFHDISKSSGLPTLMVNSTCLFEDGLLIGADSGLYAVRDDQSIINEIPLTSARTASGEPYEATDLLQLLDGSRIRSVIRDSLGRIWISTWRSIGLLRYDHGDLTVFRPEDGLLSDRVRNICEWKDGLIAVSCTGGISIIDGDTVVRSYTEEDGIQNTEVLNVANGFNDDLIIGTDGGGMFIINDEGITGITSMTGLLSEVIMRIKYDPKRNICWFVSGSCIGYLDEEYELHYLGRFPYTNNFDLVENNKGDLWVFSSDGIYVVKTDKLLNDEDIGYKHYDLASGLPCISTANSYSELTEDGTLYISGTTGVVSTNINSEYTEDVLDLRVNVPFLEADGELVYPDDEGRFTIKNTVKKLTIYCYVFNYSLINPTIFYKLEGFDNDFTYVSRSDLTPITYTNLRGGEYHFSVGITDYVDESINAEFYEIIKTKAFYEEVWFYVLNAIALVGLFVLGINFNTRMITAKLEKKHREEAEKERIATELNMAAAIQTGVLPTVFPPYPERTEFDIYATMDPAREVGGDFYDFFLIDDDHLCLVIADVSGKGIPASLYMMVSKSVLQSCAMVGISPDEIMEKTNDALCNENDTEMFVTAWVGILEISTGKMICANAGHEYPFIYQPGGSFELLKDKHGFVLGAMEGMQYKQYELQLQPGAKVFVYTDGVPEATAKDGEMFGVERTEEVLSKMSDATPKEILDGVQKAVDNFVKDAEQFDDLTMLCVEYKGPHTAAETAGQPETEE